MMEIGAVLSASTVAGFAIHTDVLFKIYLTLKHRSALSALVECMQ